MAVARFLGWGALGPGPINAVQEFFGPVWSPFFSAVAFLATIKTVAVVISAAIFEVFPAGTAPVVVAGHTHGGQIRVPFTPEWSWLEIVEDDEIHVDG